MPKKRQTLERYEQSRADRKADASGAHGKEGSPRDRAADKKAVAMANRRVAKRVAK